MISDQTLEQIETLCDEDLSLRSRANASSNLVNRYLSFSEISVDGGAY